MKIAFTSDVHIDSSKWNPDATKLVADRIAKLEPDVVVLAGDAGNTLSALEKTLTLFDSIDARLLMRQVQRRVRDRRVLRLLQRWLQARILNSVSGQPAAAGAAQGGILSPLFCNIYLHPFEALQRPLKERDPFRHIK